MPVSNSLILMHVYSQFIRLLHESIHRSRGMSTIQYGCNVSPSPSTACPSCTLWKIIDVIFPLVFQCSTPSPQPVWSSFEWYVFNVTKKFKFVFLYFMPSDLFSCPVFPGHMHYIVFVSMIYDLFYCISTSPVFVSMIYDLFICKFTSQIFVLFIL